MVDEEDQWKILDKQPLNALIVTSWVTLQEIVDNQERRRLENRHHLMNVFTCGKTGHWSRECPNKKPYEIKKKAFKWKGKSKKGFKKHKRFNTKQLNEKMSDDIHLSDYEEEEVHSELMDSDEEEGQIHETKKVDFMIVSS